MPLLRKPILNPIEGLNYQKPSTMINDRGGYPKNMRLYRDELKKKEGYLFYGESPIWCAPGDTEKPVLHLCQYPLASLSIRLVRFNKEHAEKYNVATGKWDRITSSAFTGTNDDFFSTTVAENKLIVGNNVDPTMEYNDSGFFKELVGAPKAKFLEYNKKGYLLAGFVTVGSDSFPTKVMWPDTGNIYGWTTGNYGSSILRDDPNPIRGMKNLNEYTAIYKKNSIYLARTVDTSDIFVFDLVETGTGLLSNRAIADKNGVHYILTLDDFKIFNGVRTESIADKTVQREAFGRVNWNRVNRCFTQLMENLDEVWFYMVIAGEDWPTEIWKYNYRLGLWYYDTCNYITSACIYFQQAALTMDDLPGTMDSLLGRFDDALTTQDNPIIIIGDKNSYTYRLDQLTHNENGRAIDAYWESADFVADKFENYKRWLELDFEAKGHSLDIWYSVDYGANWKKIKTVTLTNLWPDKPYKVYLDVVARHIRFRFSNNKKDETFYLRQFYPYYLFREDAGR